MTNRSFYLVLFVTGVAPLLVNGIVNALLFPAHQLLYWTFEFLTWFVLPSIIYGVAFRRGGLRPEHIGLHANIRGRRNIPLLLAICAVAGPLDLVIYSEAFGYFSALLPGTAQFGYQSVVPESGVMRTVVILYFAITAGVVEELHFRGFFFRISEFFAAPRLVYLAVSPLLFALIHWEGAPANVPAAYVAGISSALAFLALGNLWPLVVGHIFTDLVWLQWSGR